MSKKPDKDQSDNPCFGCPIRGKRKKAKVVGPLDAKFLIVTKELRPCNEGRMLSAGGMDLLADNLLDLGFKQKDFAIFPSVRCVYDKETYVSKDRRDIEKRCARHLSKVINKIDPEVILTLGADAAKAVAGRAVKISKVRGVPIQNENYGTLSLAMYDPEIVHIHPEHTPIFQSDCRTLRRVVDHEYDLEQAGKDVLGDYKFIDDLQFLIDMKPKHLAVDVETLGLRWSEKKSKVLTLQFATEPGKGYLLVWDHPERPASPKKKKKLKKQLKKLLTMRKTKYIGQNLKFDASMILAKIGIRMRMDHDTLMLAALIDENALDKGLDTLTKRYAPEMAGYADAFNEKWDKSRMDLVPLDEILGYGVGDVDADLRVFFALYDIVSQDKRLLNHYHRISMPGLNAFISMEQRGIIIDEGELDCFEEKLVELVKQQRKELLCQVPKSINADHVRAMRKKYPNKPIREILSFSRAEYIRDILFNRKEGFQLEPRVFTKTTAKLAPKLRKASTSSKDHLPYFFSECPFSQQLAQHVKDVRLLGTNVQGFRKKYMVRGKIHPIYGLMTAVTGRTNSRDPNGQNFPKRGKMAKAYRAIFVPPPGFALLEADLSQAELRLSACAANDPTMIKIYKSGGDIHRTTACETMGIPESQFFDMTKDEQGLARFKAKAVNFGFIYGMWWRSFIGYAKTQYGIDYTEDEAEGTRNAFFTKYDRLLPWHAEVGEDVREQGYVRSLDGRIRHLPMVWSSEDWISQEAVRQAINSPIQCFASNLGVMSMSRVDQEIDPRCISIVGFVHDALYALVPLQYIEWGAKTLKYYMESNPLKEWFNIKLQVPIIADVQVGMNGAKMEEMEGLSLDKEFDFETLGDLGFKIPKQRVPQDEGRIVLPKYLKMAA